MSAQTGRQTATPPPPSSTRIERAAFQMAHARDDPNPVWMREMRQAARLTRTPIILATVTGMMALLICSVGGIASVNAEPAKVGSALFHTFFSLAFAVVTWVAPAVAASTVASERGGRTWEALVLTGLGPATIARGKFLAALTYISLYVVMLVPVGALPFLFGGVTATEVVAAFALLFLFAVLSVAFGLSLSSKFGNSAVAIVVTLIVAIPLSIGTYVCLGPLLSIAVHDLWPGVPEGPPVWLPTAYVRADFGVEYLTFLVVLPLAATALPAWLLYEVTVANMQSMSDDRSTGIRRWFLVAAPIVTVVAIIPAFVVPSEHWAAAVLGIAALSVFLTFMAFVFAGEPAGPSRRVRVHWDREHIGKFRRYIGPGILQASSLLLILGLAGIALQAAAGIVAEEWLGTKAGTTNSERIVAVAVYAAAFFAFVVGFTAWTRARAKGSAVPRVLLFAALFVAFVGPWIVMAITGVLTSMDDAIVVGAPSPVFIVVMVDELGRHGSRHEMILTAGAVCAAAWALIGVGLLGAARVRVQKVIRSHDRAVAKVNKMLAEEDAARVAAPAESDVDYASPDAPPPQTPDPPDEAASKDDDAAGTSADPEPKE